MSRGFASAPPPPLIPANTKFRSNFTELSQIKTLTDGFSTMSGGFIKNLFNPVDTQDAATKGYVDTAVGNFTSIQNIVQVQKDPGEGQFLTILEAIASITDASATNRYEIQIGPGIYVETDTVVMKPYIQLIGMWRIKEVIVSIIDSTKTVLVGSPDSSIQGLTLTGASGVGGILLSYKSVSGIDDIFSVSDCEFLGPAETGCLIDGSDGKLVILFRNSILSGSNVTKMFEIVNPTSNIVLVGIMNFNYIDTSTPASTPLFMDVSGTETRVIMYSSQLTIEPESGTKAFLISDGASVQLSSCIINGFDISVNVNNVGSSPNVILNANSILNSETYDLLIENTGTTGYLFGVTDFSKTVIPSISPFFVFKNDSNIITVSKKGGDFDNISAAIDFITDNSEFNGYLINVGPGLFTENQIVLKPYITITGSSINTTTIRPIDTSIPLFVGSDASSLSFLSIGGVMDLDTPLIYYQSIGNANGSFLNINNCELEDKSVKILLNGSLFNTVCRMNNCIITEFDSTGFIVDSLGGERTELLMTTITFKDLLGAVDANTTLLCTGTNSIISISNSQLQNNTVILGSVFANVQDDGTLIIDSCNITKYDIGVLVPNIGIGPTINISNSFIDDESTYDIKIEHPGCKGIINGAFDRSKVDIISGTDITLFFSDPVIGGITSVGEFFLGPTISSLSQVSTLIVEGPTMGLFSGGVMTIDSLLTINISSGSGYYRTISETTNIYEWLDTSLLLVANTNNYVYWNQANLLSVSSSQPNTKTNILLGRVVTDSTGVLFIDASSLLARHYGNNLDQMARSGIKAIYNTGSLLSNTGLELSVGAGEYFYSSTRFDPSGASLGFTFLSVFRNGVGPFAFTYTSVTDVDALNYNDTGTGTLQPIPAGEYAKHSFYINGEGVNEKYFMVYGQETFTTLILAEAGDIPLPPGTFNDGVVLIATIMVFQTSGTIQQIADERPIIGFKASGISGTSIHGNLTGLAANDHPQYLLVDGSAPGMQGNLDMNSNTISEAGQITSIVASGTAPFVVASNTAVTNLTSSNLVIFEDTTTNALMYPTWVASNTGNSPNNVSSTKLTFNPSTGDLSATTFDGVTITSHAARHLPLGLDPITTAAPSSNLTATTTNSVGSANSIARSDHSHAITTGIVITQTPDQTNATGTSANIARADHIHEIPSGTPVTSLSATTTNAPGIAASFALSDHTHAITTGSATTISATTTNSTGTNTTLARSDHLHTISTGTPSTQTPDQINATGTSSNIARADHIHNIPSGTPITNLTATTTNSPGIAASFALSDHTHAITTGAATTQTPDQINAIGTSTTLARSDHIHNIPSGTPITSLSATTTNSKGIAASFALSDHTHAITTAAPTTNLSATTTNSIGIAATLARSDHSHAITTGVATTQTPDQTNAIGTATTLARSDHVHNIPTAVPVSVAASNSIGVASTFARSDHVHNHGSQTVGTMHAAATVSVNGFMSAADKTKLDGVVAGTRVVYNGGIMNAFSSGTGTRVYTSWGTTPNTGISNVLLGFAGTIVKITASYVSSTDISIAGGESARFDVGSVSGTTGGTTSFTALTGGTGVITWTNEDHDSTTPFTASGTLSIPVLATTRLAVGVVEVGGAITPTNAEIGITVYIDLA
jgi:hypothetical protein